MANQRGRNSGITGLVDFTPATPAFLARIFKFSEQLGVTTANVNGRGRGNWTKTRAFRPGGTLALKGKVVQAGCPMPRDWRGEEGTITLTFNANVTQVLKVKVIGCTISMDENTEDTWDIALVCEITANPAFNGFGGAQANSNAPDPDKIELYEGAIKTRDPDGLASTAIQRFVIWPIGDSGEAEMQAVADAIAAAAAPIPGLKVRLASFDRTDNFAGTVTLSYATTTTAEDILNAATSTTIDPGGLNSSATTAAINLTPSDPAGDAFVETSATTQELNDGSILQKKTWAKRNSKQALEQDGSSQSADPNSLIDDAVQLVVTATEAQPATPPSPINGLKFHHAGKKQLNNSQWAHIFYFSRRDTVDEIEMEGTLTLGDYLGFAGSGQIVLVSPEIVPPAVPAAPFANIKFIDRVGIKQLNDQRYAYTYYYAPRNSKQDIELPETTDSQDPKGLIDYGQVCKTHDDYVPPATPDPPVAGLKLLRISREQLSDSKWKYIFHFARRDSLDELLQELTAYIVDPAGLESTAILARFATTSVVPAAPTAPEGTKLIATESRPKHDTAWVHVYRYGPRTSKDEIEMRGTSTRDDPNRLFHSAKLTITGQSNSAPSPPPGPNGTHHRFTDVDPLKDGQWSYTYHYGPRDTKEDEEMEASELVTDANQLEGEKLLAQLTDSAIIPATPPAPAGTKLRRIRSRQKNGGRWLHLFQFAPRDSRDELQMRGTHSAVDVSALENSGEITQLSDQATAPTAPPVPADLIGAKYLGVTARQQTDGRWAYTYRFGPRTAEEEITLPGTLTFIDPNGLLSNAKITSVNDAADRPGAPPAPLPELKYTGGSTRKQKDGKWVHSFDYDVADSIDRLTLPQARTRIDVTGSARSSFGAILDGPSAAVIAAAEFAGRKDNITFSSVTAQKVAPGRVLLTVESEDASAIVNARLLPGATQVTATARVKNNRVEVFLARKYQRGAGKWAIYLPPQLVLRSTLLFSLRKKVSGSELPLFWDLQAYTNGGNFMGLPARTVRYLGLDSQSNIAIAAPRISEVSWSFWYDSLGMFDPSNIPTGWGETTADLSNIPERTWVAASTLGIDAPLLDTADYGVFLSA